MNPEDFVTYSIGYDTSYGREQAWVIWKTTFSGRSVAKTLHGLEGRKDRAAAQAAFDAFKAEKGIA